MRLGDVAKVRVVPTPSEIEREGISRTINIMANVRGRDVNSAAADVARRLKSLEFPSEYYPEVLTEVVGVARSPAGHACLRAWPR